MEEEELEEFELLEQAAANASFSSNSSVVVKVLAKARGGSAQISKNNTMRGAGNKPENRGSRSVQKVMYASVISSIKQKECFRLRDNQKLESLSSQ